MSRALSIPSLVVLFLCSFATVIAGENGSSPASDPFVEVPTLHCLGVRWKIKGDENRNAVIEVRYRKPADADWKQGLSLLRCIPNPNQGEESTRLATPGGWTFAGSIVGLTPDTDYEVKLNLKDADGGDAEKVLKMKTWKEPVEPKGMEVLHVAPGDGGGTGTSADPFKGSSAAVAAAKPGTILLFHKGDYKPFTVTKDGTEDKPIIFRGAGDGEAAIDAGGDWDTKGTVVMIKDRKHLWFEKLTLKGAFYGLNGNSSSNIVVRGNTFRKISQGLNCQNGENSVHHFLVDNDFEGPTTWPRTKGIETYCFTYMSGCGHIVAYNKLHHVGDGVHGSSHGSWSACDVYCNEMNICTDDGMETDHCDFNIRAWGNFIHNVAHGITSQPSHAGPVYIFRNFIYNATYSPFKLHNDTSGVYLFHNTILKRDGGFFIRPDQESVVNVNTRNNLFLTRGNYGLSVSTQNCRDCDFDSDGYGGFTKTFAQWNGKHNYPTIEDAKKGGLIYSKIGAYKIDPDTCFASGMKVPTDDGKEYKVEELDPRLSDKSDALDKGVVLFGFNDGFKGKAPDLGAVELGDSFPAYGPRTGAK